MSRSILFLCTHNSARSQLAEALMRHEFGDRFEVRSAGTEATRVKPEVPVVLAEIGVSADGLSSKSLDQLEDASADIVVTVCDDARENCPWHPGREQTIHHAFRDPSAETSSPQARLQAFREARDVIHAWIRDTFSQP
ncbi:MAG: arsenate reductase ArsC [Bacteroidetes bacterium]|nr:arsenate reductase ArsC [Bacteroidota bacterium]MDA0874069.1 arsenate reductase ArsC [Bacteroidota bacterium]